MSLQDVIMITDQLPGLERAVLHGIGEPLLNPELPAMIRHLKHLGVKVHFNTNGILLNAEIQEELIDSGLDELRISLDAATPEGYKAIRDSDKFNLIVDNLGAMVDRIQSRQAFTPKLSFWFLTSQDNVRELPGLVELAASLSIPQVHLQRLVYFLDHDGYGLAKSDKSVINPNSDISELIHRSQERAEELGIELSASGLTDPLSSVKGKTSEEAPWKRCFRPWEVTYVTALGNVLPCCISPFSTAEYGLIILGNVFESSFADIWLGKKYRVFRQRHQSTSPPKCCQGCGIRWSL
jgi:MoaA/NifB/PqqE/SkfB family radical SAM enzyme